MLVRPGPVLARVLHCHEDRAVAVVDDRPAGLCLGRHGQELGHASALGPAQLDVEQPVVVLQRARHAVRGDPQVAAAVEGHVVRARDRGDGPGVAAEVGAGGLGVAADQDQVPGEPAAGVVAAHLGDLDDVAVLVERPRVGLVGAGLALLAAVGVVGAGGVDATGDEVGLDVLGTVHLGGALAVGAHRSVSGQAGVDEDLLEGEAVDHGPAALGQGDPLAGPVVDLVLHAVAGELRDIQVALGEQPQVVLARGVAGARVVAAPGDELVDVVEPLVVAHVRDDAAVIGHDHVGALVLEAAHRGVLDRRGGRVHRVDLDDPAEAVGLVAEVGGTGVPPRVDLGPAARVLRRGQAVALLLLGGALGLEVLVEVLLAREHRAPWRRAAGAVVHRAADRASGRVLLGAQQRAAGGRAVDREGGVQGDAPVEATTAAVGPPLAAGRAGELDHRHAVRGPGGADRLGRVHGRREHDALVGVLVVADQQRLLAVLVGHDDVGVVVVVAELHRLGLGALVLGVEHRGALEDRVAPPDDRGVGEPARDREPVDVVGDRGDADEGQAGDATPRVAATATVVLGADQRGGRLGHGGRDGTEGQGQGARATEDGTAGQRRGGDLGEGLVRGLVGGGPGAGVAAAEVAGDGAAVGVRDAGHGQQGALVGHGDLPDRCEVEGATPTRGSDVRAEPSQPRQPRSGPADGCQVNAP